MNFWKASASPRYNKDIDLINQEDLKPIGSIAPECNELRKSYEECFNKWFPLFLKGDRDMSVCEPMLTLYTACVKNAIKVHKIPIDDLEVDDCPAFKIHEDNKKRESEKLAKHKKEQEKRRANAMKKERGSQK